MWEYGDEDDRARLQLAPTFGFWLDYWLFLHADETPPILGCKPLGLRRLADVVAKGLDPGRQAALIKACGAELESYRRLGDLFPISAPSVDALVQTKKGRGNVWSLDPAWSTWTADNVVHHGELISALLDRLIGLLAESNPDRRQLAFVTRRLASELSDTQPSARTALQRVKRAVLANLGRSPEAWLRDALHPPTTDPYRVRFRLQPIRVSKAFPRRIGPDATLYIETPPIDEMNDGTDPAQLLTGIDVMVEATHAEDATQIALEVTRQVLHGLRVRYYVRTHLASPIRVATMQALEQGDGETFMHLPQPFWSRKNGRRKVPMLPSRIDQFIEQLEARERAKWNAATWHLAQAIAAWPEDAHTAASETWQAIEGFFGASDANRPAAGFVPVFVEQALAHVATKLTQQANRRRRNAVTCDWSGWYQPAQLSDWIDRVIRRNSPDHWRRWRAPIAPEILFDPHVGVVHVLTSPSGAPWLAHRVVTALHHLYAIRNATVHTGEAVFSRRWAEHVARVGIEGLLLILGRDAREGLQRNAEDDDAADSDDASAAR